MLYCLNTARGHCKKQQVNHLKDTGLFGLSQRFGIAGEAGTLGIRDQKNQICVWELLGPVHSWKKGMKTAKSLKQTQLSTAYIIRQVSWFMHL